MELSLISINQAGTGQFERTLLLLMKELRKLSEGCTAPSRDENQLHAVVELVAWTMLLKSNIRPYKNWYPGNKRRKRWFNFVTKEESVRKMQKISWTQVGFCCDLEVSILYIKETLS
jgi:Fe-S cluster assembly protein SufB